MSGETSGRRHYLLAAHYTLLPEGGSDRVPDKSPCRAMPSLVAYCGAADETLSA